MVKVLCNLPLECFDERTAMPGIELCTYGPRDRMLVDGTHFPFDVEFDPSTGTWEQLLARLPRGFRPDFVLVWWPDQEPLPQGLQHCPVPVVGVISDWNLTLPYVAGLWPFFDLLICDRGGQELFARLSFAEVRWWCQYAHKRPFHRVFPVGGRDIDIGFGGNLNPVVQRERSSWLSRVQALGERGIRAEVRGDLRGAAYGRFLSRCKLGFNRSIRGEMNLRAFEVPACGAVLLLERDNLEVRDFFVPDEECVLYGPEDFEATVAELLRDDARRERIAAAGHERVQQYRLGRRLPQLVDLVAATQIRRLDNATVDGDAALGRAEAMLSTWAAGPAATAAAVAATRALPVDPRPLNTLALANLRWRGSEGADAAHQLWRKAIAIAPAYVPAAANLLELMRATGDPALVRAARDELARRVQDASTFADIDGPLLPLGFSERAIDHATALREAVLAGDPAVFTAAVARSFDLAEALVRT
ncbi:MAG: glycosyltransferase [Planctomycetes bacterium]|nr:glycosyltransferase [Planctomycetota bacterium]